MSEPSRHISENISPAVVQAMAASMMPRAAIEGAIRYEKIDRVGWMCGLTPEETREVRDVWVKDARERGVRIDWDMIEEAVNARSCGRGWRPPERVQLTADQELLWTMLRNLAVLKDLDRKRGGTS